MTFTLDTRCLECGAEYPVTPRQVDIGPLHETVVTGTIDHGGITGLLIAPLYNGRVTRIFCPACSLEIRIASDLTPQSLRTFIDYQKRSFEDLRMERVMDTASCPSKVREFPVECPRCARQITGPNFYRQCRQCGSNQLQVLRSAPG
jgi:hypothetical protein